MIAFFLALFAAFAAQAPLEGEPSSPVPAAVREGPRGDLLFELSAGLPKLRIPRDEELNYRVRVGLGVMDASVGTVKLTSGVAPYHSALLLAAPGEDPRTQAEMGWIRIHAEGDYTWYSMDAAIETRVLPQIWPIISYNFRQEGTEERRREILLGERDGAFTVSYRKDTDTNAPSGTRIWKEPRLRALPTAGFDMLSAVHMVRTLVREDLPLLRFPLVDKLYVWRIRLSRGERRQLETAAGTFRVQKIVLDPTPFPGQKAKDKDFRGLFGLHGSLEIWADVKTGIPVRIQGDLPVGLIDLAIEIDLESYRGTPSDFRPVD